MHALSRRTFLGAAGLAGVAGSGLLSALAATPAWARAADATSAFAHPGLLHSRADLARMESAVAAGREPVAAGFAALAADSRSQHTYAVRNTGQITTWGRGPTNWTSQAAGDAAAAYQNALMWAVTGDVRHADKARDILDVWAASLTGITGADGQLGAGIQGFKLVNAAEILRHTGYDGWPEESVRCCERSFTDVWYPALSGYCLYANGNWDLAALRTILAIAVFTDNHVMFEDALRFAAAGSGNGSVLHRIVTAAGQGQESGRDQAHEQLALGLLADAAEVAWQQGVDLYGFADDRILANFEYFARYNLGDDSVPFTPDLDRTGKYLKSAVSDRQRAVYRPLWEMTYAHYTGRLGKPAPYTQKIVFRGTDGARVVEGYQEDHPGYGTLTYAGTATAEPTAPTAPAGITSAGDDRAVTVSWLPSAWATGYTVRRSTGPDGAYEPIATGVEAPRFTDHDVRPGRTYYYTVTAANSLGSSGSSAWTAAAAGLPEPWSTQDLGEVKRPGSAAFDGERFLLEASGTAHTYRLAHLPLYGDGVVTARVVWPLSSQYSKIGVTVRDSLDPAAPHAAMLIQGLPLHTWSGVWSVRPSAGSRISATGSTPVPPAQQKSITSDASFPLSDLGELPESATPLEAPYVEGAGDGYRLRAPYWVRVERKGRRCTGSISPDGIHWTEVGSTEVELGRATYAGLILTSCLGVDQEYAETGTGAFDNVSVRSSTGEVWRTQRPTRTATGLRAVTGADAVELSWADPDLSATYTVLRATDPAGPYVTLAGGIAPVGFGTRLRYADATGTPGATYHYSVVKTNTDGRGPRSALAHAVMPTPAKPEFTSPDTAFANRGIEFGHLLTASHEPTRFTAQGLPEGLRLDPRTGLVSGTPSETGRFTVTTTAANASGTATADLTLTVATPPPAPWTYGDLGDVVLDERTLGAYGVAYVATPGSTAHEDGTFVVRGAGTDLSVNNQGMTGQFVRRPVTGDCEITARLVSRTGATADRVGLLMTKSLSPFDQAAGTIVSGGTTAQLMLRTKVAGRSAFTGNGTARLPGLLRLKRTGTAFTASFSTDDGATWTALASGEIPDFGDAPYYVGLVVCSRDPLARCTTEFDEVSITPH
ncbi:alginate lyase family protein [Streptomyces sp. NPDC050803]|uniref:alginate lyase family protein n=1 Tax=unclassified Streptomyces TaxID=2593676 RepID=UPI0034196DA8